jgi:NAD(P) transhydrogenase subunit alpha
LSEIQIINRMLEHKLMSLPLEPAKINHLLILKETRAGESRVALTPQLVEQLRSPHYRILIESGAGIKAGFPDWEYKEAGAEIFILKEEGYPADTLFLRVKRADRKRELLEPKWFHENSYMIGFLDPLDDPSDHILAWKKAGITTFSMDVFKSLSTDDPRNCQAAMSRMAGRLAFQDALARQNSAKPLTLTLIGTGPAAKAAAMEAKKIGVPVQVFGLQEKYRSQFEAVGALYRLVPEGANQIEFMRHYLFDQTIVISAVRSASKRPPLLIDEESLKILPKGALLVDLTVNEGGSIFGSKSDQIVHLHDISIIHVSGYPKVEPRNASEAYGECMLHLLREVLTSSGELLFQHTLLKECWITHHGECNPFLDR